MNYKNLYINLKNEIIKQEKETFDCYRRYNRMKDEAKNSEQSYIYGLTATCYDNRNAAYNFLIRHIKKIETKEGL